MAVRVATHILSNNIFFQLSEIIFYRIRVKNKHDIRVSDVIGRAVHTKRKKKT